MKEARFIEGLKTLQEGSNEYSYKYNENIVYQCQIHEWRKE